MTEWQMPYQTQAQNTFCPATAPINYKKRIVWKNESQFNIGDKVKATELSLNRASFLRPPLGFKKTMPVKTKVELNKGNFALNQGNKNYFKTTGSKMYKPPLE